MKKGQLTGRPIMNALFALAAVLILVFGGVQVVRWTSRSRDIEMANFLSSLKNILRRQSLRAYGSVEEETIAVPQEIEAVCLVDRNKPISPLVNCLLNEEINKYGDKNIFFAPFDKFAPENGESFELDEDENPLCLKVIKGTVKVSATSMGNRTLVSTFRPSEKETDCISVLYNSPPEDSIDIVFLGYGYKSFDSFNDDVSKNIQVFLDSEPFKSNKDKLNFYRVDRLEDLDCSIGAWVSCDEFSAKRLASYCPNDYIVILVDRSRVKDFIKPVRSSAVSNMEKINTADNKLVVLHEFGHIFGGLADEYVDEKYYSGISFDPKDYPNCDFPPECSGWEDVNDTGCFDGCSLGRYSRPTENSVMRALNTEKFGPLNEKIILNKLNAYGVEGDD
ncbi:M64 family metallopeptidase [Candidatus Woesearchaeota archaeon]|nr:M64 family metallopeptidase [Candidatus Woesearchaeota archaeon]